MSTSKQDYETSARIIRTANILPGGLARTFDQHRGANECASEIALEFAKYFAADNPSFNRVRFLRACGFGSDGSRI